MVAMVEWLKGRELVLFNDGDAIKGAKKGKYMRNYEHCESLYWVFTQLCNDKCDHCYNLSGPQGERISEADCMAIIDNMPARIDRLILSGGEPMAERQKLYNILDRLQEKYGNSTQVMLQTNGDLLNGDRLDTLLEKGVSRIDIASIDPYHKKKGERKEELRQLFLSRGMSDEETDPLVARHNYLKKGMASFGFWGMDEDIWLGGNWARGRAMQKGIWYKNPDHNFCAIHSGGIGFLTGKDDIPQEISIQLWQINPCCPGTRDPLGDARKEKVADVLERIADNPIFQKINEGDPKGMGESIGISRDYAGKRTKALKNICLWCDEFFEKHYDMKRQCAKRQ